MLDKGKPLHELKDKAIYYAREHEVDKSVVMTVAGAANCKLDYNAQDRKGDAGMWAVFEKTRLEGKIEGMIKMLKKYNESDDNILEELMSEFDILRDEAEEYLNKYNKGVL